MKSRKHSRNLTPGASNYREGVDNSLVSYSEISQQFNMHFNNKSDKPENISQRSPSINNYGTNNYSIEEQIVIEDDKNVANSVSLITKTSDRVNFQPLPIETTEEGIDTGRLNESKEPSMKQVTKESQRNLVNEVDDSVEREPVAKP